MINVANEGNQDSLRRMVSISGNDDDQPEIYAKGTAQKKTHHPNGIVSIRAGLMD